MLSRLLHLEKHTVMRVVSNLARLCQRCKQTVDAAGLRDHERNDKAMEPTGSYAHGIALPSPDDQHVAERAVNSGRYKIPTC